MPLLGDDKQAALQPPGTAPAKPWDREARTADDARTVHEWRKLYEKTATASDWQSVHRWYPGDHPALAAIDIREKLRLGTHDRVLEVGCASGQLMSLVLEETQIGIGLDHCEPLVRRSRDFSVDTTRIRLAVAEASKLPISSASFDRVFSYSVFQCFPSAHHAATVLAEMIRTCRPGGIVFIGDVFGVMEKQRRVLRRIGLPEFVVRGLLLPLSPLWHIRHRSNNAGDGLLRRSYDRRFFANIAKSHGCRAEFLLQRVPGRVHSKARFDVRIYK